MLTRWPGLPVCWGAVEEQLIMRPGHSLERRHFIEANGPPPPSHQHHCNLLSTPAIIRQLDNWTEIQGQPSAFDSQYDIFNSVPQFFLPCSVLWKTFKFHYHRFSSHNKYYLLNNDARLWLVHFLKREKLSEILNQHFTYYSLKTETFTIFILFYSRV